LNQLFNEGLPRNPTQHRKACGTAITLAAIEDATEFSFRLKQAAFTFRTDEHDFILTEMIRSVRPRFS